MFCPVSYSAYPPLGSMHVSARICKPVTTDMSPLAHPRAWLPWHETHNAQLVQRYTVHNTTSDISSRANIAEERFWNKPHIKRVRLSKWHQHGPGQRNTRQRRASLSAQSPVDPVARGPIFLFPVHCLCSCLFSPTFSVPCWNPACSWTRRPVQLHNEKLHRL